MSMSYDKKFVSKSFTDALNQVVNPKVEGLEESSSAVGGVRALGRPDPNAIPKIKSAKDSLAKRKKRDETDKKEAGRFLNALTKEELDEEVLSEEEIVEFLDEELGPHIEYLLDEGFTEDEIESIIMEMLEEDDDFLDEGDDYKAPSSDTHDVDEYHTLVKRGMDPVRAKEKTAKLNLKKSK